MNAHEKKQRLWNMGRLLVIIGLISLAIGLLLSAYVTPCSELNGNACVDSNNIRHLLGLTLVIAGFALIIAGVSAMIASRKLD